MNILNQRILKIVTDEIDWFFQMLTDHYDKRRQDMGENSNDRTLAIDNILASSDKDSTIYPPKSASEWRDIYISTDGKLQHALLTYLRLDIKEQISSWNHGHANARSKDGDKCKIEEKADLVGILNKLSLIAEVFDVPSSVVDFATGLWALDNDKIGLMISCLSHPNINLPIELVKIIIDSLIASQCPRLALFMSRIHRCDNWDTKYDPVYVYLLLSSGQLVEALKYERLFAEHKNYSQMLNHFFDLCSKLNVDKLLNCLNLSHEEEDVLNQLTLSESRSVTPSSSQTRRNPTKSRTRNRVSQLQSKSLTLSTDSPAKNTRSARKKIVK